MNRAVFFRTAALVLGLIAAAAAGELAVWFAATRIPGTDMIGYKALYPRSWDQARRFYRHSLSIRSPIFKYDADLGFVPNPASTNDAPYRFSADGARAGRAGEAARTASFRVVVYGCSFAFSDEVSYEESWPHVLERRLGSAVVANYGVPGYGLDQAVLRHALAKGSPARVAILTIMDEDFRRSGWVYPGLSVMPWCFSKCRYTIRGGKLTRINVPALRPEDIPSAPEPSALPFIEYQLGFRKEDWQPAWYSNSYLLRFIFGRASTRPVPAEAALGRDLDRVNRLLLRKFAADAKRRGETPLILYLPRSWSGGQLSTPFQTLISKVPGLDWIDATPALDTVPANRRFMPRRHYTAEANAAVARFLDQELRRRGLAV